MRIVTLGLLTFCLAMGNAMAETTEESDPIRILYLSKSSGFQHSVVFRRADDPSHTETILSELAEQMGAEITHTKDARLVNAENLENYDVVIFYTTGDLTQPGFDQNPPMGPNGVEELLAWIKAGGGFVGFHSASDTFHRTDDNPESPYLDMLGGQFQSHGRQFEGALRVVSPEHPTMANIEDGWRILDEWYIFRNLITEPMHVLALLDPGEERERQESYNIPSYPIIWCRAYGDGRVFYNAMGHREDVWEHETFQASVKDAIRWAAGEGPLHADPNYDEVVPDTIDDGEDDE